MEAKSLEFGNFRIDTADCTLFENGQPVPLTPKAFDTLLLLVENRGRLLDKQMMMERLWPGTFVEEANLANNISLLRKALGDSANLIQTVPRRGYRFIGEVRTSGAAAASAAEAVAALRRPRRAPLHWFVVLAVLGVAIGILIGRALWRREPLSFTPITFRRGIVWRALVQADGQTIVYSASHEGRPPELFVARADGRETKPLGIGGQLLSISKHGELAILTGPDVLDLNPRGTLARVLLTGGAPRAIAEEVQDADWAPDGSLAVIRWSGVHERVEWPLGRVLYDAAPPAWVSNVRVSRDGTSIAFLLHEAERFDDRGRVVVLDRSGKTKMTSRVFTSANGLAWASDDEIWISASPADLNNALYAVNARGRDRLLGRAPERLALFDALPNGAALAATSDERTGIIVRTAFDASERELSWLDGSWLRDLSGDGRTLLFDEEGTGGGSTAHVYLRTIDGAPATDLGEGHALALSYDGAWVLARQRFTTPPRLLRIPTGAGDPVVLPTGNIETVGRGVWLRDGEHILFAGNEPHRPLRTWMLDVGGGRPRAVTPEGVVGAELIYDDAYVLARKPGEDFALYPFEGGAPRPLPGVKKSDFPRRFSEDELSLYVVTPDSMEIVDVDLMTGARQRMETYGAARPQGTIYTAPAQISADGRTYGYTYASVSSQLFVVRGIR
jgi:DNA-binding winged helix-turn-helix (wHTH) protein